MIDGPCCHHCVSIELRIYVFLCLLKSCIIDSVTAPEKKILFIVFLQSVLEAIPAMHLEVVVKCRMWFFFFGFLNNERSCVPFINGPIRIATSLTGRLAGTSLIRRRRRLDAADHRDVDEAWDYWAGTSIMPRWRRAVNPTLWKNNFAPRQILRLYGVPPSLCFYDQLAAISRSLSLLIYSHQKCSFMLGPSRRGGIINLFYVTRQSWLPSRLTDYKSGLHDSLPSGCDNQPDLSL